MRLDFAGRLTPTLSVRLSPLPSASPILIHSPPACRGLAKVNNGLNSSVPELVQEGLSELNDAIELVRTFADAHIADVGLRKHTSGANVVELAEDGLPAHAFGCFFLRGMAFFAK